MTWFAHGVPAVASAPGTSGRPTWLQTLEVLRWPVVVLFAVVVAASPAGRALLRPIIERRHSRLGYRSPEQFERDHERSDYVREDETIFIEERAMAA
jgi:hypothetical protein